MLSTAEGTEQQKMRQPELYFQSAGKVEQAEAFTQGESDRDKTTVGRIT